MFVAGFALGLSWRNLNSQDREGPLVAPDRISVCRMGFGRV